MLLKVIFACLFPAIVFCFTDHTMSPVYCDDLSALIHDVQAWSYFGYSIAACDVNNDGWDELLVGAPHETVIGDASGHDQGRLYVYARTMTNPVQPYTFIMINIII